MECMDEWTRPEVSDMPEHMAKLLVPATNWLPNDLFVGGLETSRIGTKVKSAVCLRRPTMHHILPPLARMYARSHALSLRFWLTTGSQISIFS